MLKCGIEAILKQQCWIPDRVWDDIGGVWDDIRGAWDDISISANKGRTTKGFCPCIF